MLARLGPVTDSTVLRAPQLIPSVFSVLLDDTHVPSQTHLTDVPNLKKRAFYKFKRIFFIYIFLVSCASACAYNVVHFRRWVAEMPTFR